VATPDRHDARRAIPRSAYEQIFAPRHAAEEQVQYRAVETDGVVLQQTEEWYREGNSMRSRRQETLVVTCSGQVVPPKAIKVQCGDCGGFRCCGTALRHLRSSLVPAPCQRLSRARRAVAVHTALPRGRRAIQHVGSGRSEASAQRPHMKDRLQQFQDQVELWRLMEATQAIRDPVLMDMWQRAMSPSETDGKRRGSRNASRVCSPVAIWRNKLRRVHNLPRHRLIPKRDCPG